MTEEKTEKYEMKTEHSEFFHIFQTAQFENQERRYEATIDLLDEFHRRLYAQHRDRTVDNEDLESFKESFNEKFVVSKIPKTDWTKEKPADINKKADGDSDSDSPGEANLLNNDGQRSPATCPQSSEEDDDDSVSDPGSLKNFIQIEDEEVDEFLTTEYMESLDGSSVNMAEQFHKRRIARNKRGVDRKDPTTVGLADGGAGSGTRRRGGSRGHRGPDKKPRRRNRTPKIVLDSDSDSDNTLKTPDQSLEKSLDKSSKQSTQQSESVSMVQSISDQPGPSHRQ